MGVLQIDGDVFGWREIIYTFLSEEQANKELTKK